MEFTKELKFLSSKVRKTIEKYNMIEDGDRIALGVSGGKDSLALLFVMSALRRFYPKKFELCAIYVDTGLQNAGYTSEDEALASREYIEDICKREEVPLEIVSTDIARIVFSEKEEKNPCPSVPKCEEVPCRIPQKTLDLISFALATIWMIRLRPL